MSDLISSNEGETKSLDSQSGSQDTKTPIINAVGIPPSISVGKVLDNTQAQEPSLKPTLAERQEATRGELAKSLIDILKWVIIFLLALTLTDRIMAGVFSLQGKKYEYNSTESKDVATLVLTSLSGLVGTALGFYFGSRDSGNESGRDS